MPKVEILNTKQHLNLKIKLGVRPDLDETRNIIGVVASELPQLVLDYPVFLTKNPENEGFELIAVTGFSPTENLFFHNGSLRSLYVPLDLRRQPFQACFVNSSDGKESQEVKVGLNVESKRVNETEGQALFDEEGKPTEYVDGISELLGALVRGLQSTKSFIDAFVAEDMIEPITLSIKNPDGQDQKIEGLFTINRQKLAEMKAEKVAEFHEKGYLQAAHAMVHSVGHIQKLVNWKTDLLASK